MAYSAASDVASICRNLVSGACDFGTSTSPTLIQVNAWLSSGCSLINAVLAERGYGAIPATSGAYEFAAQANSLYGAWWAERSRTNTRVAADERTRADMFRKDFDEHIRLLRTMDLSRMGVSQTSMAYAGGISKADVSAVEGDSDRVEPRFKRGMFAHPETLKPTRESAS